jgi:putative MATE family efflux protein
MQDREGANLVAVHTLIIVFITSIVYTVLLYLFAEKIFSIMGSKESIHETLSYGKIMFAGSFFIFFGNVTNAILRAEGDASRAMIAMVLGSILNIILDPFFIYEFNIPLMNDFTVRLGLGMGVKGAAYATVLSLAITSVLLTYWMFFQKKTYLEFNLKDARFNKKVVNEIFKVGLPTSLSQLSMSIMMLIITVLITKIGQDSGVAVFTTGWRVVMIAILPLLGMATAVVSVSGASYGAKRIDKLKTAFEYSVKAGFIMELIIALFVFIFASQISSMFTWSKQTAHLAKEIKTLLRITCMFFPAVSGGMISSSLFQGIGKGVNSLVITILRTLVLSVPLAAFMSVGLSLGMRGIYLGIVTGSWIAGITGYIWAKLHIRNLEMKAEKV